jgi:hypothetical protein
MGHRYQVVDGLVANRSAIQAADFDYAAWNEMQNHLATKVARTKELLRAPSIKRAAEISDLRKEYTMQSADYMKADKTTRACIVERMLDIEDRLAELL